MRILKIAVGFLRRYIYALASCLYLFTVGWLTARNRILLYELCNHFGYDPFERLLPKISLDDVIQNDHHLQIYEPLAIPGSVSMLELLVINNLIQTHKPIKLFEFGTSLGRTTLNMASNSEPEAKIYTLDLTPEEWVGSRFKNTTWVNKITQLYCDSATFDFSPFYNSVDFIFVDADHSYQSVMNDSQQALKLLKNGRGIILWHDYGTRFWPSSTHALNTLYSTVAGFQELRYIEGTSLAYLILR